MKKKGRTKMTAFGLEPRICSKHVRDERKRDDLEYEVKRHGPRDELPLTSPGACSSCSLSYLVSSHFLVSVLV